MKTPKFFRKAISDEAKLTEAKRLRKGALKRVLRWTEKLGLYDSLVTYYEGKLAPPQEEPKPVLETGKAKTRRKAWLDDAGNKPQT